MAFNAIQRSISIMCGAAVARPLPEPAAAAEETIPAAAAASAAAEQNIQRTPSPCPSPQSLSYSDRSPSPPRRACPMARSYCIVPQDIERTPSVQQQPQQQQPPPAPKKSIIVPPIKYDLRTVGSGDVLRHIDHLLRLNGPASTRDYFRQFREVLESRTGPRSYVYGYLYAPNDVDVTREVIGKDGYYFKMTTTLNGINFIWHDHNDGVFHFWGPTTFKVVKALNAIRWRIHKVYQVKIDEESAAYYRKPLTQIKDPYAAAVEDISDDEDYNDMPALVPITEENEVSRISSGTQPDYETERY